MMVASRRVSRRQRVPSQKYNLNTLEGYEDLIGGSESDKSTPKKRRKKRIDEDDEDFGELDAVVAAAQEASETDDNEDGDSSHDEQRSDAGSEADHSASQRRTRKERGTDRATNTMRPAGIADLDARGIHPRFTYGTAPEDLAAYLHSRDKWYPQLALPTRSADAQCVGGLAFSLFNSAERRQNESDRFRQWYLERGGRDGFLQHQKVEDSVSSNSAEDQSSPEPLNFLLGPVDNPALLTLEFQEATSLQGASKVNKKRSTKSPKAGWIMNLGGRTQCLEWIPHNDGVNQFLSVVTLPIDEANTGVKIDYETNAFTPKPPYRASMQIWQFEAEPDVDIGARLSCSSKPFLRAVFTWDWGDLRRMKWCPAMLDSDAASDGQLHLGLLGGIWTDGSLRVLDLAIDDTAQRTTQTLNISAAAFQVRPPGSLCSCITWLSSNFIAAGCADGSVGIWNLSNSLDRSGTADTRPMFYHQIHPSYIINITSGYPSRPHILFTLGIDGYFRLVDTREPTQDRCDSARSRVAQGPLVWDDVGQQCLFSDENYCVKAAITRRFHATFQLAKLGGYTADIAASPLHPMILCATADGTAVAINPIRRSRAPKVESHAQLWFRHEWRRAQDTGEADGDSILSRPLSRFVEGYKLIQTGGAGVAKTNPNYNLGMEPTMPLAAVHEEQTAVTRVAWNPNLRCGTWAAAGIADGLLRVEDIALD